MDPFRFKQFQVNHNQSAFKVGTDAVLLGAWVSYSNPTRVLEVGAGSGVISLMMAQRFSQAMISALEIDEASFLECADNFSNSRWGDRLEPIHGDFRITEINKGFDLIISNPPFFKGSTPNSEERKNSARHEATLDLRTIIFKSQTLLSKNGEIALVIPWDRFDQAVDIAKEVGLDSIRTLEVLPKSNKPPNRILIQMSAGARPQESGRLIIRDLDGGFTPEYKDVTKDFYLAF